MPMNEYGEIVRDSLSPHPDESGGRKFSGIVLVVSLLIILTVIVFGIGQNYRGAEEQITESQINQLLTENDENAEEYVGGQNEGTKQYHYIEESTTSVIAIHYYHLDLDKSDDSIGNFGPNYWSTISGLDYEGQVFEASKEFFARISKDPVMAVACLIHVDEVMGTACTWEADEAMETFYTWEYFTSDTDGWFDVINGISDVFVEDNDTWLGKVRSVTDFFNSGLVYIEEVAEGDIEIFGMSEGSEHPLLFLDSFRWWNSERACHYLNYVVNVKGIEMKFSFLIEAGFAPILGSFEVSD